MLDPLYNLSPNEHVSRFILKLKLYRELSGLNQNEMAEALGISHRTYQRVEAAETTLDLAMVLKICLTLKLEMSQWLNLESPEKLNNVSIINKEDIENLTKDDLSLCENFFNFKNSDDVLNFIQNDAFKQSSTLLFLAWNTRKFANDIAASITRLESSTKVTFGYEEPLRIINFIDWLNIHKPKYTKVDPVSLKTKNHKSYYSYNFHSYLNGDVLILGILKPHQ